MRIGKKYVQMLFSSGNTTPTFPPNITLPEGSKIVGLSVMNPTASKPEGKSPSGITILPSTNFQSAYLNIQDGGVVMIEKYSLVQMAREQEACDTKYIPFEPKNWALESSNVNLVDTSGISSVVELGFYVHYTY